jgi:hypothetical protein
MQASNAPQNVDGRWGLFFSLTIIINLVSALVFPMVVTDAVTPWMLITSVPPVIWGLAAICWYRSKRERFIAWFAIVGVIYWLVPIIGMLVEEV